MDKLMTYEPAVLALHVGVVALASLGIVEWLKNWIKLENGKRKWYSLIALAVLAVNVFLQMPFVDNTFTWAWNLFALGLAFMQFGHAALVKLPETMLNKAMGVKENGTKGICSEVQRTES